MEAGARGLDDRTFQGNFSSNGLLRLRETLKEKLADFMGDYTDDTLVEYIIVLLKNGRHKAEAVQELKVFLEHDSGSFVSWLWDHFFSNMHLYVQLEDSLPEDPVKAENVSEIQTSRRGTSEQKPSNKDFIGPKKHTKGLKSRRDRGWDGLIRDEAEPPPFVSTEVDGIPLEKKTYEKPGTKKCAQLSKSLVQKKWSRHDVRQSAKRAVPSSCLGMDAPRRMLQLAVREAVTSSLTSNSRPESRPLKRLRSVVSRHEADSSIEEHSYRTRSVVGMNRNGIASAIKAAAEAAQDVVKVRCSGNVFDQMGHNMGMTETTNPSSEDFVKLPTLDESGYEKYCNRMEFDEEFEGKVTMLEREAGMTSDTTSDNDGYAELDVVRHQDAEVCHSASTVQKDESVKVQYSIAQSTDCVLQKARAKDQDTPNTSHGIVNISVNVNTWKPTHYQVPREAPQEIKEVDSRQAPKESVVAPEKTVRPVKEMTKAISPCVHGMVPTATRNDSCKSGSSIFGSYSTVRPVEDTVARTIFVSNVHFAASKDSLSRHFNKFGEVLKVIILIDPATAQPKGSAYVEFVRKEAAELALSLNGTSFMSRILKVVWASTAQHEAASMMSWPRIVRGSHFTARIARMPLTRGVRGAFRAHLPIKQGARSLQWKRDATSGPSGGDVVGSTTTSSSEQKLTNI